MRRFELVIFDNDGVLVDSEPHAHPVLIGLLQENGWSISLEESRRRFLGTSISFVRDTAEQEIGRPLPRDFEDRYHQRLFDTYEQSLVAVDGVVDVLDQLVALEIPFCVASSGSAQRVRRSLTLTGLWSYFDGRAFSADDVERAKPEPDLFLHVAASLQVDTSQCVVVEDSPLGIEAATAAGMQSVGFAFRTTNEQLGRASLGVVDRMADLLALLR